MELSAGDKGALLFPIGYYWDISFTYSFYCFYLAGRVGVRGREFVVIFKKVSVLAVLIIFLSYYCFSRVGGRRVLGTACLFDRTISLRGRLVRPRFVSFPESSANVSSSSAIVRARGKGIICGGGGRTSDLTLVSGER